LEQFSRHSWERAASKVIRQSIARLKEDETCVDAISVLNTLRQHETRQPGSVLVRVGRLQHTVVLVGQDLLTHPFSQTEMKLT
jgi:hypothetical protein